MNSKIIQSSRKESDRQEEKKWYSAIFARPEVGPISVLLILFCLLGYFSIPDGQFSLNPFSGEGFNALGIRNNFRVISQLGIVALGAGMLIIAGEFDLSVGSMIGFAGGCMAMILKWGFAFVIPYISFQGGFHFESITLFKINDPSPLTALLITLCFTLAFGWFQGWLIVKSGIASFIVTLGGLFFLRGVTETAYRAFNKSPDQTAGSTTVTDLPDIKNIINIPGIGEIERADAKNLPNEKLLDIISTVPEKTLLNISEKLTYVNQQVASFKTASNETKMISTLEKSLEGAKKGLGNELYGVLLHVKGSGELVGMGRIVGDGGTVFHICDMVVKPEWQKKGGGAMIMDALMEFIEGLGISDAYVNLIADVDGFYEKWGFKLTSPRSIGMSLKINN